jgi:Fe-S-cluster containining protein
VVCPKVHKSTKPLRMPLRLALLLFAAVAGQALGLQLRMSSAPAKILRRVDKWACVSGCGACCKLGPLSSRPDLKDYLTPAELTQYTSMIGKDDWCVHFDQTTRMCTTYETRPDFCKVRADKMRTMFDVEEDEVSDFAAFCCREHIGDNYGENSIELERFEEIIDSLYDEDEDDEEGEGEGEGGGRVQVIDLSKEA